MYNLYSATIELTGKCNAKCKHCIVDAGQKKQKELTTNRIMKLIEELHDEGCQVVFLTGGEPFLRKDWILIAQKLRTLNIQTIMMTNGLIIDDKIIKTLSSYNIAIGISLDGYNAKTHDKIRGIEGIFNHFVEIIPKLKASGIRVSVATTVMQSNFNQLDKILKLLLELKIDTWQLQIVKPCKRLPKEELLTEKQYYKLAKKIAQYRKKYNNQMIIMEADCIGYNSSLEPDLFMQNWKGCECGIFTVSIESNGNVKGCPNMNNSEGNITKTSFAKIWNSHNSFKYNRTPSISKLTGFCKKCEHKYTCRGGCPINAKTPNGNSFCLYKIEQIGTDK